METSPDAEPLITPAGLTVLDESFEGASAGVYFTKSIVSGWLVLSNNIDIVDKPAGLTGPAHTGAKALDLNGSTSSGIRTNLATVTGEAYLLTFAYTKNPGGASASAAVKINGATLLTLSYTNQNSLSALNWQMASVPFTATGAVTRLELQSLNRGNAGVFLDSFKVVAATPTAPVIVAHPQDQTVVAGETASFEVRADGTSPLSYQWFFNGRELSGATLATLTLANAQAANAGNYSVVVSNALGSISSSEAELAVTTVGLTVLDESFEGAPTGVHFANNIVSGWLVLANNIDIVDNPAGLAGPAHTGAKALDLNGSTSSGIRTNLATAAGEAYLLTFAYTKNPGGASAAAAVKINGATLLTLSYTNQNSQSALNWQMASVVFSATNSVTRLELQSLNPGNAGMYLDSFKVVAATPTAPVIVAQPQDQTVVAGETASFEVRADGTGPLIYRWFFDGRELSGATEAALAIANAQAANAGNYSVVVSNALGWVASVEAELVVTPAGFTVLDESFEGASTGVHFANDIVSGWLVLSNNIDIVDNPAGLAGPAHTGAKALDLNGSTSSGIRTNLATAAGEAYLLTFAYTKNPGGSSAAAAVKIDGATVMTIIADTQNSYSALNWQMASVMFSATSAVTRLELQSLSPGNAGVFLDSFKVVAATPTAPVIVAQPQDQTVVAGETATFALAVSGGVSFSYQWRFNGTNIDGATSPSFLLANAQAVNAGAYSVVVSNELGSVTSREAILLVTPAPIPSLYDLSRDFSLASNPNGTWSYGYKSALNSSLELFAFHKTDYDERGTPVEVWSKSAYSQPVLEHNATSRTNYLNGGQAILPPGAVWLVAGFDETPDNFSVARITVPPAGDGQYELKTSVQPVYAVSLQGDTDFHVVKNGIELFGAALAGTQCAGYTNTLTLAAGDTIDFAVGRGTDGHEYASSLQLEATVDLVSSEPTAPAIVRQPRDLTVVAGEAAGFAVVANGTGPLSYQWRWNGNDLAGATGASLTLENAQAEHAGRYSVVVTNELGAVTSAEAVLTVAAAPEPPVITSQPRSQTVLPGSAVSFSVAVTSTTPVTYQWEFNGNPIAGATAATLSLANVQIARAGTYRVSVANAGGSVTSEEATLMLQAFQQPPTFIAQSGAVAAPAGTDAALWVSAFGSEPLSYQWFFNGAALAGATASTLTLSGVQAAQAGTYTVAVSNPYGAVTNNGLLLNVVGPAGGGGTVNLANNAANPIYDTDGVTRLAAGAAYRAQLYGGLTPEALQPIGTPVNIGPIPGRFMGGTRVVPTVPPGQTGWFVVKVWESAYGRGYEEARLAGGKHGASEPFAVLTANSTSVPPQIPASLLAMPSFALVPGGVLNPPEITAQPQGQTVALGASVTLGVSATGPGALRYQWFKDENLLAGASGPGLNISGAAVTDAGDYVVVVSNPAGSVTSLVATVAVTVERQLYLSAPAGVNEGDLVSVPLTLVSRGEVGGLTFALTYNPDALTLPEVAWDSALEGALKLANTPAAGRLQGVFAFGAGTVPAGTQVVATISFRARTVTAAAASALALEVIDLANAAGEPIVFGTAVAGGSLAIASAGSTDNNANGAIDAGDATLLLRLLARLDTIRPWDVARNDLNANGVLDSGDAIKLLRAAAEAGAGQVGPAGVLAERAVLSPARLRAGGAGQLVTLQVRLEGLTRPVVAGDFAITYPAGAVRLAPKQAPKAGALMAANALLSYSDDGAGRLHVVISSPGAAGGGAPVVPAEGVLAEVTFEVLAGAASQYAWGLGLGRTLAYSDGYTQRTLAPSGAVLIGRSPLAGGLGAVRRQAGGQFAFRLSGDAGADYLVEASADLQTWAPWKTVTAGAEGLELLDSEAATLPQRFYRVRPVE